MSFRLIMALAVALTSLVLGAGTAGATVNVRLANIDSPTTAPYDLDQTSTNCTYATAARDTTRSYTGAASLKVHIAQATGCGAGAAYARGIFNANGSNNFASGDDFWVGAAIYLPSGFWAGHDDYNDFIRLDNFVNDAGTVSTPSADRQQITFAAFGNDNLYMRALPDGGPANDIGPIAPSNLPEGQWNWVEMHIVLNATSGSAVNELKINGVSMGSNTLPNLFGSRPAYNRVRYGLVSTDDNTDPGESLDMWVDRATVQTTQQGPIAAYSGSVLGTSGIVSYWRLGESSGTSAADSQGSNTGTYTNSPTLGATGLIARDGNTAVNLDGTNDHVVVPQSASLNPTSAVSIEAWAKADALQGTVLRRSNSYELRMESDGSVLFRVWVAGNVQSLSASAASVTTGTTYHLVGTYDGANLRIYRNGTQIASRAQTGAMTHSTNTLYVGYNDFSSTYFDGTIDDVAIYNTALSSGTVAAHYTAGS